MNYRQKTFLDALDTLICLRVQQGEEGQHLPKGVIEDAKEDLQNALVELLSDED